MYPTPIRTSLPLLWSGITELDHHRACGLYVCIFHLCLVSEYWLLNVLKNFKYVNFILKNMQQVCCNPFIVFREWSITHSDNLQTWNNYICLGVLPSFRKCYNTRIQYSQRHTMINHCDRRITHLSDTDTVQSETYHDKSPW